MNLGTAQIIQGNALALPLPDTSVDLICTSPPYFRLRSYQDGCPDCANNNKNNMRGYMERYCPGCGKNPNRNVCIDCGLTTLRTEETKAALRKQNADPNCQTCGGTGKGHYDGQIGSEATPAEFLDALLSATREMVRVLKPSGSIFVNLGDKYSGPAAGNGGGQTANGGRLAPIYAAGSGATPSGIRAKSLMGIPWRYAIACIDDLGLILRAEIIWSKPNGLPESATDRVRRSHETWFHFTKSPRYFAAVDEIREPHTGPDVRHFGTITPEAAESAASRRRDSGTGSRGSITQAKPREYDARGKLPGSVWTIPTQPLTVPPELGVDHFAAYPMEWPRRIIQGWTPNGGTVLDPFMGTGTTLVVARALGRNSIGVDLSRDYCRLAAWRVNNPGQIATALQIEKPDPIPDGQLALFSEAP